MYLKVHVAADGTFRIKCDFFHIVYKVNLCDAVTVCVRQWTSFDSHINRGNTVAAVINICLEINMYRRLAWTLNISKYVAIWIK